MSNAPILRLVGGTDASGKSPVGGAPLRCMGYASTKGVDVAERIILDEFGIEMAIRRAPPHLEPLFQAMRDTKLGILFIGREAPPRLFQADTLRGVVVLVGDDRRRFRYRVNGPDAFDQAMVAELLSRATFVCVRTAATIDATYAEMLAEAAKGGDVAVAIAVRRPVDAGSWISLVKQWSPQSRKVFGISTPWTVRFGPGDEA